jgi:hypothetical protein
MARFTKCAELRAKIKNGQLKIKSFVKLRFSLQTLYLCAMKNSLETAQLKNIFTQRRRVRRDLFFDSRV